VTTRLPPYAGLGLAHFVSTLVVCGVAALVLPPSSCEASVAMDASAIAAASHQTLPEHGWTADIVDPDPFDSSDDDDDDGGDDAPGASSAIVPAACHTGHSFSDSWRLVHTHPVSCSSHTSDGHSLRGPPPVNGDSSDVDIDEDEDDDDRFAAESAPHSAASCPHTSPIFYSHPDLVLYRASDGPSLRAP
jgi:hypothetical protein